jgi:hypothetical protein
MANSPTPGPGPDNKPAHEVRLGAIKAAIWQNSTDSGVRYNVTFERLYNQEGEWRSTNSFGRDDSCCWAKLRTWRIRGSSNQNRRRREGRSAGRNAAPDLAGKSLPKRATAAEAGG